MGLIKRKLIFANIKDIFDFYVYQSEVDVESQLHFFSDIVSYFRPADANKISEISIAELIEYLKNQEESRKVLSDYMKEILSGRKFSRMITDVGILQDSDFLYEVKRRLFAKILPEQPQKNTMEYVLNQVFYKEDDFLWIKKIEFSELLELFEILEFKDIFSGEFNANGELSELLHAIGVLTQRMSGRSMESNIIDMVPEYTHLESPFLGFEDEFIKIEKSIRSKQISCLSEDYEGYKQLSIMHGQCLEFVNKAFNNSHKFGITLKVNQALLRIRQQLKRAETLIELLIARDDDEKKYKTILLSLKLIEYNCYKNNVSALISDSTQLISYEITQHTAKTGEHYITSTAKEYFSMFKASLGAGLIVGFLCIFKLLLGKVETSSLGYAFLYSMNYALGFIAIYLMGYALATKQPAMTATTIIRAIEEGIKSDETKTEKHSAFAHLFARLFRSQFIAFVGNIIMAFAVALLLVFLVDKIFGINIALSKADKLLEDASPVHSLAVFHAAIAGVFLFLSGIISGSVSNSSKYNQIYYRIKEHPVLKRTLGKEYATKLSKLMEKKWPGIVSNFWFGIFMGSTYSIGEFIGLNLDIRHITFVSGNIALGAYGKFFEMDWVMWFWVILGVIVVGFVNFMVSFSLSLGLALRSRNIPFTTLFDLNKSIWIYFKKKPIRFFFPLGNNK